jgi:hypothetical protein
MLGRSRPPTSARAADEADATDAGRDLWREATKLVICTDCRRLLGRGASGQGAGSAADGARYPHPPDQRAEHTHGLAPPRDLP